MLSHRQALTGLLLRLSSRQRAGGVSGLVAPTATASRLPLLDSLLTNLSSPWSRGSALRLRVVDSAPTSAAAVGAASLAFPTRPQHGLAFGEK